MRFLREFMETGTVLFVSHDTGAILNLCKGAIWLDNGIIKAIDTPKEITERYLQNLYESQQDVEKHNVILEKGAQNKELEPRDMRLDFINQSNLRNDIELFEFLPEASGFGDRAARITGVQLLDKEGIHFRGLLEASQ